LHNATILTLPLGGRHS